MHTTWYVILGLTFAGYLALAGYDYGVGLLLARRTADPGAALNAVGPFFLGNEVWLVATVGILFGAFPTLEGELLTGLYPAVALAVGGAIMVTAAVQLRARAGTPAGRLRWVRLVVTGSLLAAGGWGTVLGGLLQGLPLNADGHPDGWGHVVTAFTAGCALSLITLAGAHGAAFLALRLPAGPAAEHARSGRRLIVVALAVVAATALVGVLSPGVRASAQRPAAGALLLAVLAGALLAARSALRRRRPGLAFAATATAMAVPVLLVGVTTWPYALFSTADPAGSLTVAEAAASPPTLRLLSTLLVPLLPALVGFQAMCWWAFRGRVHNGAPRFY